MLRKITKNSEKIIDNGQFQQNLKPKTPLFLQ